MTSDNLINYGLMLELSVGIAPFFTFGLDLLTVGRDDDTLNLMQLHVLGDLSETHDQPAFGFSLGRILLVDPLREANQFR